MVKEITSASELDTLVQNTKYVMIDFHAQWCGPCRRIAPYIGELATKHGGNSDVAIVKVDVDSQSDIAAKYEISAMPTFVFVFNGTEVKDLRIQGASNDRVTSNLDQLIKM